jgi:hypothetical protein
VITKDAGIKPCTSKKKEHLNNEKYGKIKKFVQRISVVQVKQFGYYVFKSRNPLPLLKP